MRTQSRSIVIVAFSTLLAACGEGSPNDPNNVTDTSTPKLTSSTPSSKAVAVQIDQEISLVYSTDIDAKTVNDMTVMVMPMALDVEHEEGSEMDTQRIKGKLTTTGKTVKFMPTIHFERGQDYHVIVKGVKSTAGVQVPSTSIAFRTRENPMTSRVRYPNGVKGDTTTFEYNAAGYRVKETVTDAAGAIKSTEVTEYDAAGDRIKETDTNYLSTGTVITYTLFNTPLNSVKLPDAAAVATTEISYDDASKLITGYRADFFNGGSTTVAARLNIRTPGDDLKWNLTDDILSRASKPAQLIGKKAWVASRYIPKTTGTTVALPIWSADTQFSNPDLILQRVTANVLDANQRTEIEATFSSLGANLVFDTPDAAGDLLLVDDVLSSYTRRVYDATNGRRIQTWSYSVRGGATAGADLTWFRGGDDVPTGVSVRTYDPMGMLKKSVSYRSAGPDLDWNKFDDNVVSSFTDYTYSGMNRSGSKSYIPATVSGGADILVEETTYDTAR